jgi:hypothetical protein
VTKEKLQVAKESSPLIITYLCVVVQPKGWRPFYKDFLKSQMFCLRQQIYLSQSSQTRYLSCSVCCSATDIGLMASFNSLYVLHLYMHQ